MTTLEFHRDLYSGVAVDAAVEAFREVAACELVEKPTHWVVMVTALADEDERSVVGELANYALGLTIEERCLATAW